MRFICLHGMGTNSRIFESQLSAVRDKLGDQHTFEYVNGSVECKPAPGIEQIYGSQVSTYRFWDDNSFSSREKCNAPMIDLENYLEENGPFDGIIAFSEGAGLAASFLAKQGQTSASEIVPIHGPVKCAVFFSGGILPHYTESRELSVELDGEIIDIPTAHIWGENDKMYPHFGHPLSKLCKKEKREVVLHQGGHEIPTRRLGAVFSQVVDAIERTIVRGSTQIGVY